MQYSEGSLSHKVGAQIKAKRLATGLTLNDLSLLTELSISTLSCLERGIYTLTVPQLVVLATTLCCPTAELLVAPLEGGAEKSGLKS